eukprot:576846_1
MLLSLLALLTVICDGSHLWLLGVVPQLRQQGNEVNHSDSHVLSGTSSDTEGSQSQTMEDEFTNKYKQQIRSLQQRLELLNYFRHQASSILATVLSPKLSRTYVVSVIIATRTPLIEAHDVLSVDAWQQLQADVRGSLHNLFRKTNTTEIGSLSTFMSPFKQTKEAAMYYKFVAVLTHKHIIPIVSQFVTSSSAFTGLITARNCTEYRIIETVIKDINDFGSDETWTLIPNWS